MESSESFGAQELSNKLPELLTPCWVTQPVLSSSTAIDRVQPVMNPINYSTNQHLPILTSRTPVQQHFYQHTFPSASSLLDPNDHSQYPHLTQHPSSHLQQINLPTYTLQRPILASDHRSPFNGQVHIGRTGNQYLVNQHPTHLSYPSTPQDPLNPSLAHPGCHLPPYATLNASSTDSRQPLAYEPPTVSVPPQLSAKKLNKHCFRQYSEHPRGSKGFFTGAQNFVMYNPVMNDIKQYENCRIPCHVGRSFTLNTAS